MEKETICTFAGNRSAIILFKSLSVAFHHIHPDHMSSIISLSVQLNLSIDTASLNKGRRKEERKSRREEGSNERNVHYLSAVPNNVRCTSTWFSHIRQLPFHSAGRSPERSGFGSGCGLKGSPRLSL